MKKNQQIELCIDDINNLGCGVGRYEGKVVFVKGAVSGDKIRATVIKDNKSFTVAKLDCVLTPSPNRATERFCTAPLSCGGCTYRHITYEHELITKHNHVRACFDKVGLSDVRVLPVVSTGKTSGYRNKAQYPVAMTKNGMRSGFFASKTHNIAVVDNCAIQHGEFAEITREICALCDRYGIGAYSETTGEGLLRHIYLRMGEVTGQIMLCLVINGETLPHETDMAKELVAKFPNIASLVINTNTENTNVVLGKKFRTVYGKPYIEDVLCGLRFCISPDSFYQVNREGAELLYGLAADLAGLDGTVTLADLYCGTGTIGLSMASAVKSVTGIEIVKGAVDCAVENAKRNGIENAEFFCGDAGDPETILKAMHGSRPDVVVIDPPRKGSTRELAECLAKLEVPKVVYISCDPATLARDCTYFRELGYTIGEVQPVDMFPRTGHVECVVSLTHAFYN